MIERTVCKSIYVPDATGGYTLSYYILHDCIGGYETYGIGIEKKQKYEIVTEAEYISDIFTSDRKAMYVLDILCHSKVAPCRLGEALEEIFNKDMQTLHCEEKTG